MDKPRVRRDDASATFGHCLEAGASGSRRGLANASFTLLNRESRGVTCFDDNGVNDDAKGIRVLRVVS